MSSPPGEPGRNDTREEPQHAVTLTNTFAMWKYEVTQKQFKSLMNYNPSKFQNCGDNCPVEQVSWYEALAFANEVSKKAGLEECFACQGSGKKVTCDLEPKFKGNNGQDYYKCPGYRLPT